MKRFIPESVKQTWHDWRSSMKSAEHAITGSEDVNEHIDKIEKDFKLPEQAKSNSSEWRFNFGKHNGETLKEVANSDPSYISWIRKEDVATQRGDLAMALKEYDASKSWFSWGFTQAKPVEVTSDATNPVEGTSEAASAPAPDAWGVEAATEKNKHDASKFYYFRRQMSMSLTTNTTRSGDTTCTSLRHSQVFHLRPSTYHSSRYTESCSDSSRLGLGYREENYEGSKSTKESIDASEEAESQMGWKT